MKKDKFCRIIFLAAITSAGIICADSAQKIMAEETEGIVEIEPEIPEQPETLDPPVLNETDGEEVTVQEDGDTVENTDGATGDSSEDEQGSVSYEQFMTYLTDLETYADSYAAQNPEYNSKSLVLNYLRTLNDNYLSEEWETLAGPENTDFKDFVAQQDAANGTNVGLLSGMKLVEIPNGEEYKILHLFGVMDLTNNMADKSNDEQTAEKFADLAGWAGDLVDLLTKTYVVTGENVEEMTQTISASYLGYDLGADSFSQKDIDSDLDGYYLTRTLRSSTENLSTLMAAYFTDSLNNSQRARYFVENRFEGISTKDKIRQAIYSAYQGNELLGVLESKRGLSEYADQRQASCYSFADYLYDNLPEDYKDQDEPDNPDDPTPVDPVVTNPYYSVFYEEKSTLAPGVEQSIHYANTADDKQIVYYTATVDLNRDDLHIYANYHNNDGSSWGMQSVRDQAEAAIANHADDENFTPVVAVNADFFNMSTGQPGGALVMEGVVYQGARSENFFAILDDGTPIIAGSAQFDEYADRIIEAVGASVYLIRDGEIKITSTTNYYNSRASRTCVGITEDGKVVLMVLDGRQEPFSAGGSAIEIAQIMKDAGCVVAVNLDGGGSTTYLAKQEGEDELSVVNHPSDGFERQVSSSILVVSSAPNTSEFDHATLLSEYSYVTTGSNLMINAIGVSGSGGSAQIPDNAVWTVADPSIGTIDENGVFTAVSLGDALIHLMSGDDVVGSITIHVVEPDGIYFSSDGIDAIYGQSTELPVVVTYQDNEVLLAPGSDLINIYLEREAAGTVNGLVFTANDEDCGVRTTLVGAALANNTDVNATSTIHLYKENEATFDFENATDGDRSLAWIREVTNSTKDQTDSGKDVYKIQNPDEIQEIHYTFALDMNNLAIPENIANALPVLAAFMGQDAISGATAWELLLSLAERISPSTTVNIEFHLDPRLEVDYSELMVNCQYFELTSVEFDPETSIATMVCNWIKVDGAIDAGTANPLCVVTGIKARPKDDANWDSNNQLNIVNTGTISYVARLRSSQAYSIAGSPFGASYGLRPYDNSANLVNDKGAEFSSVHAEFSDEFILDNTVREGWITEEDGSMFYYIKNVKQTGIQLLPDVDNSEESYYYQLGDTGVSRGKYTGLIEDDGGLRYALAGELKTGWREISGNYYYFEPVTHYAVDGIQKISNNVYTFENYILVKGAWEYSDRGVRYFWADTVLLNRWHEIDGELYYLGVGGYRATGVSQAPSFEDYQIWKTYVFDENGVFQQDLNGFYEHNGDTRWAVNGELVGYPGLVEYEGNYYYFKSNGAMVKDSDYTISKTNDLLPTGTYHFDENGMLCMYNGIVDVDGTLYYFENGLKVYAGLIQIDEDYYYVKSDYTVVRDTTYYVSKNNDLMPVGYYAFDADGKMIINHDIAVTGVTLDQNAITLNKGDKATITATVTPEDATNTNVTWTSSDEAVATVVDGKITAVGKGTATITVTTQDGGFTATCEVTVDVPVDGVTLNESALTLNKGDEATITATVTPEDATNTNVTWTSSDEAVATVVDGKITAVGKGTAVITVTTVDGSFSATCEVTVDVPIDGVTLNESALTLNKGDEAVIAATVSPEDATNTNVIWSSSDEAVATVVDGKITAVGKGTATITVTTQDGGFTATCEVTVDVPVDGVTLNESALTLNKGDEAVITATVTPEDATNTNVTWTSSDEAVATVVDGKITAVGKGTAVITVTTVDGSFSATCEVTVDVPIDGVTLNESALTLNKGDEAVITATVTPEDATNTNVTWTSSDEAVATVVDGKITAVGKGTAIITVTTEDGSFTATCEVTVNEESVWDVKHSLALEGNIGLNFFFYFGDDVLADQDATVEFTIADNTTSYLVKDARKRRINGVIYRAFTAEVTSVQMTTDIKARVLTGGEEVYSELYSVKDYCDEAMVTSQDPKLVQLMNDLLNYGGYAQVAFNANTDDLANKDLDSIDVSDVTPEMLAPYAEVKSGSLEGLTYNNSSLTLESLTTINHIFTVQSGHDISEFEFKLGDETITPVKRGRRYNVAIPNIAANNLDESYTVTVGEFEITYSALSYAHKALTSSAASPELQNLARALYKYNQAANSYFG